MNRRDILKYVSLITGAAVSAPLAASLLTGCNTPGVDVADGPSTDLKFFNKKDFALLKDLVDTILPKTDSPAASEVGVHTMIDHMVGGVYGQDYQQSYKAGFNTLSSHLNEKAGKAFSKLDGKQKLELLQQIENSDEGASEDLRTAYLNLKQQTVAYYLNSKEIGTKYLNYLPIPGEYKSCITLEEVGGKAWAL